MKLELTVGVYDGDVLIDTVCYVVPVEPLVRIFAQIPEDSADVFVSIEGVKELYE